ncbi:hypothetical protein Cgig2_009455 [Carnegiea gigantea]|uniref:Uncharacterized protein n=1 Tax=Carnegiea gigantea TaxID=171969 RepID=A0A9Q1K7D5_9CARY|nr:hypothetical protein Cgig2_009455 [Carnegiea gigantea]
MPSNSSTEPLSITNSENGDNENLNQISSLSDTSKSHTLYPVGGSRSDHICIQTEKTRLSYAKMTTFVMGCSSNPSHPTVSLTAHPPLPSSTPHSNLEIGNSSSPDLKANEPPCFGPPASPPVEHVEELIALCLLGKVWGEYVPLPAIINKTKADWKFIRGQVKSLVNVGNPSPSKEPVTSADQWIQNSPKKRFRSMPPSNLGKLSPLKPPTQPKVTIVDPPLVPNEPEISPNRSPSQPHDKGSFSKGMAQVLAAEDLILAHYQQIMNQEVPTNMDPLNAMDEDLLDEPNGNDYEDLEDILVDEEEIALS